LNDVTCFVARKPLWLEHGQEDPEFPEEAFITGIEVLKKCYKGREENLTWQIIAGGHRFKGQGLEEWFRRWL
jgi:hypothetical protein